MITVQGAAGPVEAWLATPVDAGHDHPGVLLFMDALGLREQIHRMAQRIASWGYVVLAPNAFYRSGDAATTSPRADLRVKRAGEKYFAEVRPRLAALTPDLSRADTAAYLSALAASPGVADAPLGVVGYCMGVRLALRAAGDHPDGVAAVAGFHGGGLVDDSQESPHLSLGTSRAAVLLRHADADPTMPPEHMEVLERTAADAGVRLDQAVYPGAAHGYSMADTSMYDEASAERHFVELEEHLAAHLGR
jgi:carboxymethylenebutenolidase